MQTTKPKLRRGIGYIGRVFDYGTACGPDGCRTSLMGPHPVQVEQTKKLNKLAQFKRAAKKRQRLDDFKGQDLG